MVAKLTNAKACPKCGTGYLRKAGKKPNGKQIWACRTWSPDDKRWHTCYKTVRPDMPYTKPGSVEPDKTPPRKPFRRKIDAKTIIFTAAQNATPVHEGFFAALKACQADLEAELAVIPLRYKNPTSIWTESQANNEVWAPELAPYLYEQRKKINDNLVVVGDLKIQPTRVDPLSGMDSLTQGESGIVGHTKLRLKTIATPQNRMPKTMTTTGAVTKPNYTDSVAGQKGAFHHVQGAVIVEVINTKKFHLHHVNARKDGAFIFRDKAYYPDGTAGKAPRYKALVFGDAHYRFADPTVVEATFGPGGLVEYLNPEVLVWHDLLDCYWGNPHHRGNPFIEIAKRRSEFHLAEREVTETIRWMESLGKGRQNIVVASNHDDMFGRWILREDWKQQYDNAEFYLETALQMVRSAKMVETGAAYLDPFAYWIDRLTGDNVRALKQNEPFSIADIYLAYHGDKGPRGARGTVKNLSQIGVKLITGHGHSPEILDGHYRTGTMTRTEAEYTAGSPGDWQNTHASIDGFDKRHLHTCVDGEFFG